MKNIFQHFFGYRMKTTNIQVPGGTQGTQRSVFGPMPKGTRVMCQTLTACSVLFFTVVAVAQSQAPLEINPTIQIGLTPPIPISIDGFSGEGLSVLEFDLYVQGFSIVPSDQAQYHIKGSDEGNVVGRLSLSSRELFSRSYTGQNVRREAHAFADDIVQQVTGKRGIGQTKIAFKVEGAGGSGEIYVSDFDGHNAQAVTTDGAIVAAPAWVPGRFALLYTSYKLGNPDIFYSDLSTGQRRVFAAFGGLNTSAAVSPDGRQGGHGFEPQRRPQHLGLQHRRLGPATTHAHARG